MKTMMTSWKDVQQMFRSDFKLKKWFEQKKISVVKIVFNIIIIIKYLSVCMKENIDRKCSY